jgi:putative ABC transport system permease protein
MNMPKWKLSVLDSAYRFLLKGYPAEFRERYETPMAQVFRDRCREEFERKGTRGLIQLSLHTLVDLVRTVPAEHLDRLSQDVRYGGRVLRESPGFTTMAVLALALGIGANSAIFSAMSASLQPLPYKEPERLVVLHKPWDALSKANFDKWREQNKVFEQVAAFCWDGVNLTGGERPEYLIRARVSNDYFPVLGVTPRLGRTFLTAEARSTLRREVVISFDLWQRRYHSDPMLIGKSLSLNDENFSVVGIMPAGFYPPGNESVEAWTPLDWEVLKRGGSPQLGFPVIARLKPGVTLEIARADIARIDRERESAQNSQVDPSRRSGVDLLNQHDPSRYLGPSLAILQICVTFMLLLACANVAALLLARATQRQKEMSIRSTLGATRPRLIRQLLTESLMLALLGGALGLLFAFGLTHLMASALSSAHAEFPWYAGWRGIGMNGRVLGFTLLTTLLTGLVFGLTPAMRGSKASLNESLQGKRWKWSSIFGRQHIHSWLVVLELAVALALLTRVALVIQEFRETSDEFRMGLNPAHVLTMEIYLSAKQYPERSQIASGYQQILQKVRSLPNVQSVGAVGRAPWFDNSESFSSGGLNCVGIARAPESSSSPPKGLATFLGPVDPGLLQTMRIPMQKGRYFTEQDLADTVPPAIIDEGLAYTLFRGEDPIGKTVKLVDLPDELKILTTWPSLLEKRNQQIAVQAGTLYFVVGVRGSLGNESVNEPLYVPYTRAPISALQSMRYMNLIVRTHSDPMTLAPAVSSAVWAFDKDLPISRVRTLEQRMKGWSAPERLLNQLLAFFTAAAMILAAVGIFGLMTYVVAQRTREIGVRLSLGARPSQMLRLVMIQGMNLILVGVAFGLILAFTLPVFLGILYEIITLNPETFSGDLAPQRVMMMLLGILAGTAVILAISGIYNMRRESSSHPRPSRGIAPIIPAFKWLVRRASKLTITGIVLGLLLVSFGFGVFASWEGARMMHPPIFIGASLLLAAVALMACYLTARRAIGIDPMTTLRSE